ncbi:MAG TPA: cytochrome P450, partial [Solirubrobacteraceae bacterium]|nr:cytochrome P450 [Solirubrobacteraceae bacterium]
DEEIIGNVFTLLIAGEDTTAHTMAWTLWSLASRPEIQDRWANEAREVLGEHPFPADYEAIERLSYGEARCRGETDLSLHNIHYRARHGSVSV